MDVTTQNDLANFETAIRATKFGKFNYLLMFVTFCGSMAPVLGNTVMSYVIPAAQCDLNLSLPEKGALNAAIFVGFLISSYFCGFFADILGRRKILFIAYTTDFLSSIIGSFMHTFALQYICKFIQGIATGGHYAILITYISEYHSSDYRSKLLFGAAISMLMSLIILPVLVIFIMPLSSFFIQNYELYSWQIFMLISTIPSFISAISFAFLSETPKFLMTAGQNEKALKLFRKMYSWNTGKPEQEYPIKQLINENIETKTIDEINQSSKQKLYRLLQNGFLNMKILFLQPHLRNIFIVISIYFGIFFSLNTLRLWLPQIFTLMDEMSRTSHANNITVCYVIENSFNKNSGTNVTDANECKTILPSNSVYYNLILLYVCCLLGHFLILPVINRIKGNTFIALTLIVSGFLVMGIYWSTNQIVLLILLIMFMVTTIVCIPIIFASVVELFPTNLRGVAVSVSLMVGQIGAIFGNLLFPYLLQIGCLPPFLFMGITVIICGCLCFTLPTTAGKIFN